MSNKRARVLCYNLAMSKAGWKTKFLYALRNLGSPTEAARTIEIPLSTAYSARSRDPSFRRQWDSALATHQLLRDRISIGAGDKDR